MWNLVFNVTFDGDNCRPCRRRFERTVTADEMFDAIDKRCFFDGKYMFTFDEDGRSPKHGVRIFNKVMIDTIA